MEGAHGLPIRRSARVRDHGYLVRAGGAYPRQIFAPALAFIVFEVDIALTFPVVVVYASWIKKGTGWVAFVELILFTAVLLVGLAWAWAHGDLEWIKKLSRASSSAAERENKAEKPPVSLSA